MKRRLQIRRVLARCSLFLAALLYASSASAGPWLHLLLAQTESTREDGGDGSGQSAPHPEQECALCHSLASDALPAAASPAVPLPAARPSPALVRPALQSRLGAVLQRARAPPQIGIRRTGLA